MRASKPRIILSILLILLVIISSIYTWTYLQIRKLPIIADPVEFSKEYDPKLSEAKELMISTPGFGFDGGRTVNSPLFPYTELQTVWTEVNKCPYRYLDLDLFWNVFWVEIAKCGPHTEFFGPYRASTELRDLY